MRMTQNLQKLLQHLASSDLEFVIVGGFAAVLHGCNQTTRDIDICLGIDPSSITQLRDVLAPLHPRHRMTGDKLDFLEHPRDGLERINNLYLETDFGILDIISAVTGVGDFNRVRAQAQVIPLLGQQCLVINIQDLITAKKAMGDQKDLIVAQELETICKLRQKKSSRST